MSMHFSLAHRPAVTPVKHVAMSQNSGNSASHKIELPICRKIRPQIGRCSRAMVKGACQRVGVLNIHPVTVDTHASGQLKCITASAVLMLAFQSIESQVSLPTSPMLWNTFLMLVAAHHAKQRSGRQSVTLTHQVSAVL